MRLRAPTAVLTVGFASALLATAADAARPAGRPPDEDVLRAAGLRVSWPVGASTTLAAGDRLVVRISRVRARHAGSRLARLSLVRVDGDGRAIRAVARRTLVSGRFSARLPRRAGARYALRLAVAGRRYWSWIRVGLPAPGPQPAPDPQAPAPPPSFFPGCRTTGLAAAELRVDPPAGRIGDRLTVSVVNTGLACLYGGWGHGWERLLPDGTWRAVEANPPGYPVPAILAMTAPGSTSTHGGFVWPELTPGLHRLTKTVDGPAGPLTLTAPFTVLPEPGT